jgi:hypothetical protein
MSTIAETRSKALIRMLISWSSMLDKMTLWYSPTRCGWLGTILTSASRAMYLTGNGYRWITSSVRSKLTVLIRVLQESSQFCDASPCEGVPGLWL